MLRLLLWLILWLLRPKGATPMLDPFVRDVDTVDEELAAKTTMRDTARRNRDRRQADARQALADAANHQRAIDACTARINDLLDERNLATTADRLVRQ